MKQYSLYGCPMHLGVSNAGITGAINTLKAHYPEFNIEKIDEIYKEGLDLPNLKNLDSVVATCEDIAKKASKIVKDGEIPIFIGGDHAAVIGSISGVCEHKKNLGLFWVDSHSDINTEKTTVTGNIHGMPVSALLNMGEEKLTSIHFEGEKILPQNVVLFGLRDVDPPEQEIINQLGIKAFTHQDIVDKGLVSCLIEAKEHFSRCNGVHLSFDLDSIDPDIIKGVSVPVLGGFNKQDAVDIMQFCLENLDLTSIDIVEFNPANDQDGETLAFLAELINLILHNN